jgi:hypothetical protein
VHGDPGNSLSSPAGHGSSHSVADDAPRPLVTVPPAHAVHDVLSGESLKLFGGHIVQLK